MKRIKPTPDVPLLLRKRTAEYTTIEGKFGDRYVFEVDVLDGSGDSPAEFFLDKGPGKPGDAFRALPAGVAIKVLLTVSEFQGRDRKMRTKNTWSFEVMQSQAPVESKPQRPALQGGPAPMEKGADPIQGYTLENAGADFAAALQLCFDAYEELQRVKGVRLQISTEALNAGAATIMISRQREAENAQRRLEWRARYGGVSA
jgi:hypothetical protein